MAAGDKNAVLGGNPTESISAYEDAAADRVAASLITDSIGAKITGTNPFPVNTGFLIAHGRTEVPTPGTDVSLGSSLACSYVLLQGLLENSQPVTIGLTGVDGAEATRNGIALMAGEPLLVATTNRNLIFVDAIVADNGVTYFVYG